MKKYTKYIIIASIIGMILGKYTFNEYEENALKTMKEENNYVYLMQYGVYKDENIMKENATKLKNYFFFLDEKGYHVLIGITKNKKNKKKIVDSYELLTNIYMKRVKIDNEDFIEVLNQYDTLIDQTDDKAVIINAEKQILSKYEELVLSNEQ